MFKVEKGKPEVKKIHTVVAEFTFTDEDLADETPISLTKREFYEIMSESENSEVETVEDEDRLPEQEGENIDAYQP